ncbi:MAG: transporter [Chlorobiaceae bacterium]|nr:transporter [Chlorobiaceae bacterium]
MHKKAYPLALAATLFSATSFAAMPLVTDDTGTQGKGGLQVELGMERQRANADAEGVATKTTAWAPATTLTYGLADKIDLVAGMPYTWRKVEAGGTSTTGDGIGDLSLQLKWRFLELQEGKLNLALKPGITLPTGKDGNGFGTGRRSGGMLLAATHKGALGAVHVNLGYTRNEYRLEADRIASKNDIWHASIAGELNMATELRAVADIGVDTNKDKDNDINPAYLLGGIIYSPSGCIDLDFGVKGGLNAAQPATSLLAGVTMHF